MNPREEVGTEGAARPSTYRRRLLRIHGTILSLVASTNSVVTTYGWMTGSGPFGFMRKNPLVWTGFIQAYLLMLIIAVLLIRGAGRPPTRPWHVVGALAHCPPLLALISTLSALRALGAGGLVWIPAAFHVAFLCLEGIAALTAPLGDPDAGALGSRA